MAYTGRYAPPLGRLLPNLALGFFLLLASVFSWGKSAFGAWFWAWLLPVKSAFSSLNSQTLDTLLALVILAVQFLGFCLEISLSDFLAVGGFGGNCL